MEFTTFTAGKDDEGKRLDRVVRAVLDGRAAPDSRVASVNIFQALRKKLVKLNGSKAEASARVHEGDKIEIACFLIPGTAGAGNGQPNSPTTAQARCPAPGSLPLPSRSSASTPPTRASKAGPDMEILFQNIRIV